MSHKVRGYASDLTDDQWGWIEKLLPRCKRGRPISIDLRSAANEVFYLVRTGCPWDQLPREYPNHNRGYYHYHKWCGYGTWARINTRMCEQVRLAADRAAHPSAASPTQFSLS